ncbi:F-box protein At3g07870-like [Andrographis paniculata]|uniref:F-box protein At3g07870-like n=1 Tax=Andrographis paniculata TaxID=175694 RepID=UPI0021E714FD|nr:F-box protein At3g07870-like [Andrographis paniculata]
MNQELLANLPSDIVIDVLSRLPIRAIISCKCVCKSWLNLLNTAEFINYHHSKSTPGIAVLQYQMRGDFLTLFEIKDELEPDEHHELHYIPITQLYIDDVVKISYSITLEGSTNGLLLLREISNKPDSLYICNPITREYTKISSPENTKRSYPTVVTYGFGVSSVTGHHKVVWISHDCIRDRETHKLLSIPRIECCVYTLETGSWRSISPGEPMEYTFLTNGGLLNGRFHCLVRDLKGSFFISCLDLETEVFTTFSSPCPLPGSRTNLVGLAVLESCLCLCDNTSNNEIVIWIMKEYGVEKSWRKEFVISKIPNHIGETYEAVHPIKIFKDGDILMCWWDFHMLYYCNKTKVTQSISVFTPQSEECLDGMLYSPSFLSLKSRLKEDAVVSTY